MPIALIVHGGAWAIPTDQVEAHLAGCRAALEAGYARLEAGASAIEAVEVAVRILEDDPIFDAGKGSVLTTAGTVELDAAIMDGNSLRYGALAGVSRLPNPISVARKILEGPATFLVGAGAEAFAAEHGFAFCDNETLIVERERQLWLARRAKQAVPAHGHDTVGAIALDAAGNIIAANSTGGTPDKLPGRVGDTPLVGCGLYADAEIGACVATGHGEAIVRVALARRVLEQLEKGQAPSTAASHGLHTLRQRVPESGGAGCIVLTPQGHVGWAYNTPAMAYAFRDAEGRTGVAVQ